VTPCGIIRDAAQHLAESTQFSVTTLYRCVAVYLVLRRMGEQAACANLNVRHVRAVLPLAEAEQDALLRQAQEKGWTARELVRQIQSQRAAPAARAATPGFVRAIRQVVGIVREDGLAFADLHRRADVAPRAIDELFASLVEVCGLLERLLSEIHPKRVAEMRAQRDESEGTSPPRRCGASSPDGARGARRERRRARERVRSGGVAPGATPM
jgi:hypothetical protein